MKRILLFTLLSMLAVFAFAATPRAYTQVLVTDQGDLLPGVENTSSSHHPDYYMEMFVTTRPEELVSTATHIATQIRICKFGNGTTVPFATVSTVQLSAFSTQWVAGEIIRFNVTHIPTGETATWDCTIPEGTATWGHRQPINPFPEGIVVPPYTPVVDDVVIQGHFTSVNWDFNDIVIITDPVVDADAIVIDPITGEYSITVPTGWSGVVSPTKAGYIINPEYREYANLTEDIEGEDYAITKFVDPNVPVITYPAAGEVFTWEEAAPITFTWEAPEAGFAPEYYEVKLDDAEWVTLGNVLAWTSDALGEGEYIFNVRAVINTALGKVKTPLRATLGSAFGNVANKGAGPVASVEFEVIIETQPDIPADIPTPIAPGVEIESDIDLNYTGTPTPEQEDQIIAVLPNFNNLNETVVVVLSGQGTTNLSFTIEQPGSWYAVLIVGGNVVLPDDPNHYPVEVPPTTTITFTGVNFGAKGDVMVVMGTGTDPTLPVELSSFNAVLTAQNFVKLSWTSESETNMLGYRVYRSETDNQAEAQLITPIMIEATNTSTTQHYGIEDKEVSVGYTYYYWLEAVDYSHSSFYGYRSVEVVGEIVPELPVSSIMGNAYPNPFKATTNTKIDVRVKAGENANVTIYNVLGQVVKSYKVSEGAHTINWDGRDSRGKLCGSGIYFYKMSTPSLNQTKKMVIVK